MTMKIVFFAWACVACVAVLSACGVDDSSGSNAQGGGDTPYVVQQTSDTTFYVYDNDGYRPDLALRRTCETIGMVVIGLSTDGNAQKPLHVVCGPKS